MFAAVSRTFASMQNCPPKQTPKGVCGLPKKHLKRLKKKNNRKLKLILPFFTRRKSSVGIEGDERLQCGALPGDGA
jgi:hypothetical protein